MDIDGFKYCRDTTGIHIDFSSQAPVELGTRELPFQRTVTAWREIFNYLHKIPNLQVRVLFRQGTHALLFSMKENLLILGVNNFTITSYGEDEDGYKDYAMLEARYVAPLHRVVSDDILTSAPSLQTYDIQ